jgi:hypothetical protein
VRLLFFVKLSRCPWLSGQADRQTDNLFSLIPTTTANRLNSTTSTGAQSGLYYCTILSSWRYTSRPTTHPITSGISRTLHRIASHTRTHARTHTQSLRTLLTVRLASLPSNDHPRAHHHTRARSRIASHHTYTLPSTTRRACCARFSGHTDRRRQQPPSRRATPKKKEQNNPPVSPPTPRLEPAFRAPPTLAPVTLRLEEPLSWAFGRTAREPRHADRRRRRLPACQNLEKEAASFFLGPPYIYPGGRGRWSLWIETG